MASVGWHMLVHSFFDVSPVCCEGHEVGSSKSERAAARVEATGAGDMARRPTGRRLSRRVCLSVARALAWRTRGCVRRRYTGETTSRASEP